jgi:hypothetical protein
MVTYEDDPLWTGKSYGEYGEHEVNRKGLLRWKPWWEFIWMLLGVILELVLRRKESRQVLFFPLGLVEKVRVRCNKEVEMKEGVDPGLSHGDVLSALLFKVSSRRPFASCGSDFNSSRASMTAQPMRLP